MNKKILAFLVVGVLAFSGFVMASPGSERVYVYSESPVLKAMVGVRHEFPEVFSTQLSPALRTLKALGLVKTEPVVLYEVDGKPVCGDDEIHPSEDCGEPGLSDCPSGYVCENCKCVEASQVCYPDNEYPWGIVKVNGGAGGGGVKVAVLDTGVDTNHPDLSEGVVDCEAFGYRTCEDGHGHGTHVAGTVLADGKIKGVAPSASLFVGKVCSDNGSCWGDDIAAGIRTAADSEVNIISMSVGGDSPDSGVLSAVDYAVEKGVLVVAAAGNDGPDEGSIDYPGAYYKVVAVGAINVDEEVASFSSRGVDDGDDSTIGEGEIELAAPGVDIESTYNDGCYDYMSGTSMATPHVSGLAAKLWQGGGETTRSYLRSLAKDLGEEGYDTASGYGLPIAPFEAVCSSNLDCDDGNDCTDDVCVNPESVDAYCENTWAECGLSDGCCGPDCTSVNDPDCESELDCSTCFKGVCDGHCHPAKEDAGCSDCN